MDLKVFILLIIAHSFLITTISAYCSVELTADPLLRPLLLKQIGSRTAVTSNEKQLIILEEGEQISAHCKTRFKEPSIDANKAMIVLKCESNYLVGYGIRHMYINCDSMNWNLYESSTSFRWCPPAMASYILARPSQSSAYEYLAGICYNFNEMSVVSLHYAAAPKFSKYTYPHRLRSYTPTVEVQNIPISFVSRNITVSLYDNPQFQEWIKFANYQNHSIVQNPNRYNDSYDKFGGLLDFAWWPGLRSGNWRRYEEALSQHIEVDAVEYDMFAGISGTVAAPIYKESCQENLTLVELADRANRKIPLYVWHYLKSTKSDNDNLVVIGVNSPFYEFYSETDLIFCNDICPQIGWLQKVQATFHYRTMGIIFCCSVDEVRTSNRLTGFPVPPKAVTPPPLVILRSKPSYDELGEPNQTGDERESNENVLTSNDNDY